MSSSSDEEDEEELQFSSGEEDESTMRKSPSASSLGGENDLASMETAIHLTNGDSDDGARRMRLRAKTVHERRGSVTGAVIGSGMGAAPSRPALAPARMKGLLRSMSVLSQSRVPDHSDVSVSHWRYDRRELQCDTIAVGRLAPILDQVVERSTLEFKVVRKRFDKLGRAEQVRRKRAVAGLPRAGACRWFHLPGCNHTAVDIFSDAFKLSSTVVEQCKDLSFKPSCSWHQGENSVYDHLLVTGHYIIPSKEKAEDDGFTEFTYEQVNLIYLPDLNTLISIDGNGEKTWNDVSRLLHNVRGSLRTGCDVSLVMYKMIDSMIDEVYPLLDLYADLIEDLERSMIDAPEPTEHHVRISNKVKRCVHSLRRYAWNARQLLQELRQNNFGVLPLTTVQKLMSVERNSDNLVQVACAYMEQV